MANLLCNIDPSLSIKILEASINERIHNADFVIGPKVSFRGMHLWGVPENTKKAKDRNANKRKFLAKEKQRFSSWSGRDDDHHRFGQLNRNIMHWDKQLWRNSFFACRWTVAVLTTWRWWIKPLLKKRFVKNTTSNKKLEVKVKEFVIIL